MNGAAIHLGFQTISQPGAVLEILIQWSCRVTSMAETVTQTDHGRASGKTPAAATDSSS